MGSSFIFSVNVMEKLKLRPEPSKNGLGLPRFFLSSVHLADVLLLLDTMNHQAPSFHFSGKHVSLMSID